MTYVRSERYLWLTWLSKLIAGEIECVWSPWFRVRMANYKRVPSDFQLAQWTTDHTFHLRQLVEQLEARGHRVSRESQNKFVIPVAPGMLLSGKPDVVAVDPNGKITVYDVKTGMERQSGVNQVMLAMLYLPRTDRYRGKTIHGRVVYANGRQINIPASAMSQYFSDRTQWFIDRLNADAPPSRAPSRYECRFCHLTKDDCADRLEWDSPDEDDTFDAMAGHRFDAEHS